VNLGEVEAGKNFYEILVFYGEKEMGQIIWEIRFLLKVCGFGCFK
jgi:hypothetical protein